MDIAFETDYNAQIYGVCVLSGLVWPSVPPHSKFAIDYLGLNCRITSLIRLPTILTVDFYDCHNRRKRYGSVLFLRSLAEHFHIGSGIQCHSTIDIGMDSHSPVSEDANLDEHWVTFRETQSQLIVG